MLSDWTRIRKLFGLICIHIRAQKARRSSNNSSSSGNDISSNNSNRSSHYSFEAQIALLMSLAINTKICLLWAEMLHVLNIVLVKLYCHGYKFEGIYKNLEKYFPKYYSKNIKHQRNIWIHRARLDCLTKPSYISHLTKSGQPKLHNTAIFAKYNIWSTDHWII